MLSSIKGEPQADAPQGPNWDAIRPVLRRYVRGRGARHDVADDVVQETLTRLVELARTQQIASVFALAFRISDNVLIDIHRRDRVLSIEVDTEWRSDEPSLDRVVDSRRAIDVFNRCLKRMPALRREVLIRRRINQKSCRAIGEDLAMSAKAVEKHITRGMIDLRRALDQAGIDLAGQD